MVRLGTFKFVVAGRIMLDLTNETMADYWAAVSGG